MEMKRVLKENGSIYLHCDPTASHYLKLLMDAVFGKGNFRNEVIWKRTSNHNDAGRFGRASDRLLFYGAAIRRDGARVPLSAANVNSKYRHEDERGRYGDYDLTGPGLSEGESGKPWRGYDPGSIGRCWSVPRSGDYAAWIEDNPHPRLPCRTGRSGPARHSRPGGPDHLHFRGDAAPQALPGSKPRRSAARCVDRHPTRQLASQGSASATRPRSRWRCWNASSRQAVTPAT